jgi:hypothetical protein
MMVGEREYRGMGVRAGLKAGLAAVVLWAAGAVGAIAQEEPGAAQGVARLATAAQLADWGRERDDPGALILAARMVAEVPLQAQGDAAPFFTSDALLDEALAMSGDDPAYAAAIAVVRQDPTRGVVTSPYGRGPIATVKTMRAREAYSFDVIARPNEILRVAAIGDGDVPLDLSVRDSAGRVLCRSGVVDHYPVCTVRPRVGRVRIEVTNGGGVWSRVQILSN